jgi:hypothetical protein
MTELAAPQRIWLELFQKFLERGVRDLRDLASLNTVTHALLRTVPAEEAQSLLPQLSTVCAICHQHGQPDGPRCDEHQFAKATLVIYMGDEGSAVGLCGDCLKVVEQLMVEARAQNPTDPEDTDVFDKPLRQVN